jgi:hypothetical protein
MAERIPVYDDKNRDHILGYAEADTNGIITIKLKVPDILSLDSRVMDYADIFAFMLGFYFIPGKQEQARLAALDQEEPDAQ